MRYARAVRSCNVLRIMARQRHGNRSESSGSIGIARRESTEKNPRNTCWRGRNSEKINSFEIKSKRAFA